MIWTFHADVSRIDRMIVYKVSVNFQWALWKQITFPIRLIKRGSFCNIFLRIYQIREIPTSKCSKYGCQYHVKFLHDFPLKYILKRTFVKMFPLIPSHSYFFYIIRTDFIRFIMSHIPGLCLGIYQNTGIATLKCLK